MEHFVDDLSAYEAERDWHRQEMEDVRRDEAQADALSAAAEAEAAMLAAADEHQAGEHLAEKVHDLLDQKRVLLSVEVPGARRAGACYCYVLGDHEPYVVVADNDGVRCSCWAARMGSDCAHRYVAMVAWAEQASVP